MSLSSDLLAFCHLFLHFLLHIHHFSSVAQLCQFCVTPWNAARQATLSIINFQSLLKLRSIESVMPCNHLILCCPLLLLPSIFPSIRVFSKESDLHIRQLKYWSFSFSISPSNEYSGLISFRMDWLMSTCIVPVALSFNVSIQSYTLSLSQVKTLHHVYLIEFYKSKIVFHKFGFCMKGRIMKCWEQWLKKQGAYIQIPTLSHSLNKA